MQLGSKQRAMVNGGSAAKYTIVKAGRHCDYVVCAGRDENCSHLHLQNSII